MNQLLQTEVQKTIPSIERVAVLPGLPNKESNYPESEVYLFLDRLAKRMTSLVEIKQSLQGSVENTSIDQVVIEKNSDGSGMIWGFGLSETGVENFPTTPLMFSLSIKKENMGEWESKIREKNAAKEMRRLVWEQLFAPDSKGNYFIDVHGWGESVANRMPDMREVHKGIEEAGQDGWVGIAISPYGEKRPDDGPNRVPKMSDVVSQVRGSVEKMAQEMDREFNPSRSKVIEPEKIWARLKAGVGHSMGGWVIANLIYELIDLAPLDQIKWLLENPVIYGADFTPGIENTLQLILDMDHCDPNHVQLLRRPVTGQLVQRSPSLMSSGVVATANELFPVVETVVKYYLAEAGIEYSRWKQLTQEWYAKYQPEYIQACNDLLQKTPCIVTYIPHLRLLRELGARGDLGFAVGKDDRVLSAPEQINAAAAMNVQRILETSSHTPKEGQGIEIGRLLVNGFGPA